VRVNTRAGPGNFHMKPNGMLYVAGEFASIVESVLSLYSPELVELAICCHLVP
jgi:uncharacterized protein YigE (DUF2233 family)